jgi:D-tyrosyl-tRNA(Tyr) deacylase
MSKKLAEKFSVVGYIRSHHSTFRDELSDIATPVSQFTLLASTKKGNKPDFHGAAGGEEARYLYQYFFEKVQQGYVPDKVQNGVFQAMMEVALVNDGPVRVSFPGRVGDPANKIQRSRWKCQLARRPVQFLRHREASLTRF